MTLIPRQVCPACGCIFDPPHETPPSSHAETFAADTVDPSDPGPPSNPELAAIVVDPVLIALAERKSTASFEMPSLTLNAIPEVGSATVESVRFAATGASRTRSRADEQPLSRSSEDDAPASRRSSRLILTLLASYASAATFGLIWFVAIPKLKARKGEATEDAPAAAASADPGARSGASRKVDPPAEVPDGNRTELGKPLKVDSVEVTAIDVVRKPIVLLRNRVTGGIERREEAEPLLVLRLRFRNVSDNLIFAPFDETFVRDNDQGMSDSLVEFAPHTWVYPYPLARQSEWSIEGQSFRELKPGETLETVFVTSIEGNRLSSEKLFWRIRIRTGLSKTAVIGVTTDAPPES